MLPTKTSLEELINENEEPVVLPKTDLVWKEEYNSLPKEVKDDYIFDERRNCYTVPDYIWAKHWRAHGPFYKDSSDPRYVRWAIGGSTLPVLFDGSALSDMLYLYDGQHGSPYKSAIEEYAEKIDMKLLPKAKGDDSVLFVGHNEEQSIRDMFERLYQKDHPEDTVNVINDTHMYQCGARDEKGNLLHPYCLINPDGVVEINGIRGVLECKTCSFKSEDFRIWKSGRVPLKYYLQVVWYMAAMNLPYAYIVCKMGMYEGDYTYIYIERNREIEEAVFSMADQFVACLENRTEPATDKQNIDLVYRFWLRKFGEIDKDEEPEELPKEKKSVVMEISAINNQMESLKRQLENLKEEREDLLNQEIFPELKSPNAPYAFIQTNNGQIELRFRKATRYAVDEDRLKKDEPKVYEHYLTKTTKFNTSLFKKEMPLISEAYKKEQTVTDAYANYCDIRFR